VGEHGERLAPGGSADRWSVLLSETSVPFQQFVSLLRVSWFRLYVFILIYLQLGMDEEPFGRDGETNPTPTE
jgi:hypothetical protein